MPLARIIASKPAAARETAKALRQSGYEVEIVIPGWRSDSPADLEYNLDTDTVISQPEETFVLGEREFFLVPLWRNWMARLHSSRDVARAQKAATARLAANALPIVNSTLSFAGHHTPEDESARLQREEDALTRQRELRAREAELTNQAAVARKREQEAHLRQQALLREQKEAEDRKQEALLLQRQEEAREQEAARQQLILRQREEERQREALRLRQEELRQQEETRQRDLVRRRQEELRQQEIIHQHQLLRRQEELRRQEAVRRQQQELMQYETLKAEQEAALARKNDIAIDATPFIPETIVASKLTEVAAETNAPVGTVVSPSEYPPLREYIAHRWSHWHKARRASPPEENKRFTWKQAWPVAAGVAVAFLLGWAASSYDGQAQPVAHAIVPATNAPVKYAPYPVQRSRQHQWSSAGQHRAVAIKRAQPIRRELLQDEVVIRRYPSNATTAQNKPMPHPKRISDLQ